MPAKSNITAGTNGSSCHSMVNGNVYAPVLVTFRRTNASICHGLVNRNGNAPVSVTLPHTSVFFYSLAGEDNYAHSINSCRINAAFTSRRATAITRLGWKTQVKLRFSGWKTQLNVRISSWKTQVKLQFSGWKTQIYSLK